VGRYGVFFEKKTVERMGCLENTYFKLLDKDSCFIFFILPSHFHLGFRKPQFDIGFRTKFSKKNIARQTCVEFPLTKHRSIA
jgi:hypothetical protein